MDPLTAGIVSGGMGLLGTVMSNDASSAQAARQMEFQEKMSGTAHQREVSDLRKAGLNPVLSALGQGASTPGGAQGSVSDLGNSISKGVETATAVRMQNKQFDGIDADISNKDADTGVKKESKNLVQQQMMQTAADARSKILNNKLQEAIIPSLIKKAKVDGDFAEINAFLGATNAGLNGAKSIKDIINPLGGIIKGKP